MNRTRYLLALPVGVVKARTIKRLPPGERWTGSLVDEAHGSELAPNALEDDGGGVWIRAPVLQPHAAVPLPQLVPEFRQVRRAPLRRADFELGYTDNCPGCVNARAGRKQPVDRSEQCRSRMEASVTTTGGHMRQERARPRFCSVCRGTRCDGVAAQETFALRAKGSSLLRNQHQQRWSRVFEVTTRKVVVPASIRRCLQMCRLQSEVRNRRPT